MLKHILLSISMLALIGLSQVDAQTHFSEEFTTGIPATWNIVDGDGNTTHPDWPQANAGCGAYPASVQGWTSYCDYAMSISWYLPAGQSDDWLISPSITIPSGSANAYLRFDVGAVGTNRQANFQDDYAVRLSTSGNAPGDHTNLLFSDTDPIGFGAETPVIDLSAYIGQTVHIAFQNFANNEYLLFVDNVEVVTLKDDEISASEITMGDYSDGVIRGTFTNQGASTITSAEVNYQIAGGTVETATVTGLNIAPFASAVIEHPTQYTDVGLKSGIRYWVTQVNGVMDPTPADNEVTKPGSSFSGRTIERKVLIETFTSSTCGPCRPGNANLDAILTSQAISNPGRILSIKFQQNFPAPGDPYCTDETQARRNYYGITGIPASIIEGFEQTNSNALTDENFTSKMSESGYGSFSGYLNLDPATQDVYVTGTFTSSVNLYGNERLQLAIVERETFRNTGNNGETEFTDVVKKLLPSQNGTTLGNLQAGDSYTFDQVYTLPGSYRLPNNANDRISLSFENSVENFNNLYLVAWVENTSNNFVLNSGSFDGWAVGIEDKLSIGELTVSPNPASTVSRIDLNLIEASTVNIEVFNELGQVVLSKDAGTLPAGSSNVELNVSELAAGVYHITAHMEKGHITRPLMIVR